MDKIRVVIAVHEPLVRKGMRLIKKHQDFIVTGEAGNGSETVRALRKLKPDLVFLDVELPVLDASKCYARLPETTCRL